MQIFPSEQENQINLTPDLKSDAFLFIESQKVSGVLEIPFETKREASQSFYLFIGDGKELDQLSVEINLDDQIHKIKSPATILIPPQIKHNISKIEGKGWIFRLFYNSQIDSFIDIYKKNTIKIIQSEKQPEIPYEKKPIQVQKALKNPKRWKFASPELLARSGVVIVLHQVFDDKEFDLMPHFHSKKEDQISIFFSHTGQIEYDIVLEKPKKQYSIQSPTLIYYPPNLSRKAEYKKGKGFMLVILKETTPGAGYEFNTNN